MATDNLSYDILILGGGLVGASLALALSDIPLRIGIIDALPPVTRLQTSYDSRSLVLSYGSQQILANYNFWDELHSSVMPIKEIHISERGHLGLTRLQASEYFVPALGYVVEAQFLAFKLNAALDKLTHLTRWCSANIVDLITGLDDQQVVVRTEQGEQVLKAQLVVAADGANSIARKLLGIQTERYDYHQTAIVTNFSSSHPNQFVAYERFTDTGPLAVLPRNDDRCGLVWTVSTAEADCYLNLSDHAFLAKLQDYFGYRLGRFTRLGTRQSYPLQMLKTKQRVHPGVVLIGNAAQTVNPIAAQGFNLGLRDVALLAELIKNNISAEKSLVGTRFLQDYAAQRERDQRRTVAFTDKLAKIFSINLPPLNWVRSKGLIAMDIMPPLKRSLMFHAMGLANSYEDFYHG